ncbi:MAG: hypothetical protein IKU84_05645, partial [Clostridia bacterium]|nr:hypothetical protein [Clostridia bacterium]
IFKGSDGVNYAQVTVKVEVVTLASKVTLSEGGYVDAVNGADLPTITPPTKAGYIFDGYYDGEGGTGTKYYNADGSGARVWDKSGDVTLYAKWIEGSTALGKIGVFMRNIKTNDGKYKVHLFSGINSLNYKEVGFEVIINGEKRILSTKTVFRNIKASNDTVTPAKLGDECIAIFAHTIEVSEELKGEALTYRPYAKDKKGKYIYGKTVTISKIYQD